MQRVNTSPQEETEQIAVVQYCRYAGIPIYAVPNGGSRNRLEAIHLKAQGVSPGVPDLVIPLACSGFYGLYIEMKREKGSKTSQAQKDWIATLTKNGYCARICKGFDEARQLIDDYRGGKLKNETEKPHAVEVEIVTAKSAKRTETSRSDFI